MFLALREFPPFAARRRSGRYPDLGLRACVRTLATPNPELFTANPGEQCFFWIVIPFLESGMNMPKEDVYINMSDFISAMLRLASHLLGNDLIPEFEAIVRHLAELHAAIDENVQAIARLGGQEPWKPLLCAGAKKDCAIPCMMSSWLPSSPKIGRFTKRSRPTRGLFPFLSD